MAKLAKTARGKTKGSYNGVGGVGAQTKSGLAKRTTHGNTKVQMKKVTPRGIKESRKAK